MKKIELKKVKDIFGEQEIGHIGTSSVRCDSPHRFVVHLNAPLQLGEKKPTFKCSCGEEWRYHEPIVELGALKHIANKLKISCKITKSTELDTPQKTLKIFSINCGIGLVFEDENLSKEQLISLIEKVYNEYEKVLVNNFVVSYMGSSAVEEDTIKMEYAGVETP